MICLKFTDGRYIIGFSGDDLDTLRSGRHIDVPLDRISGSGIAHPVMIVHEETDQEIMNKLAPWFTERTVLVKDPGEGNA